MAEAGGATFETAVRATESRYRRIAPLAARFVGGKLRRDPVYRRLAEGVPHPGPIVDLGCGLGQTALLLAALQPGIRVIGVDWDGRKLRRARDAADDLPAVSFVRADVRRNPFAPGGEPRAAGVHGGAGTVLMLDVLHFHPPAEQDALLSDAAAMLASGGRLWLRDLDAAAGWRAAATRAEERVSRWLGWHRGAGLHYRTASELLHLVRDRGLRAEVEPSWRGTPFGNVLITAARRPAEGFREDR